MKKNYTHRIYFTLLVACSFFVGALSVVAHAPGTIDPLNLGLKYAKVIHAPGTGDDTILNAGKFTDPASASSSVTVTDTELTGYMWGEEVGWINLNCSNNSSCGSTPNLKVSNNTTGHLSGYAWGSTAGWVNFAPSGGGVVIDASGYFNGYAWSQNFGWIQFDCSSVGTGACVQTDWLPGGSSGGGGGGPIDVCPNIIGVQSSVPVGNHIDGFGNCVPDVVVPVDLCPNIAGTQTSIPNGYIIDVSGNCVVPVTVCTVNCTTTGGGGTTGGSGGGGGMVYACSDGRDNDGDGLIDFPRDPGCITPYSQSEVNIPTRIPDKTVKPAPLPLIKPIIKPTDPVAKILGVVGIAFAIPEFIYFLMRLFQLLMSFLGWKPKKAWGVVYDSRTKQPIDPAYVSLFNQTGKEVESVLTDINGRYGFLVAPSMYTMSAQKTNYEFPSKLLAGKLEDELYEDLYFGEQIEVKEQNQVLRKNIPLDQMNFDWNEFQKQKQGLTTFFAKHDILFNRISKILFYIGFVVSAFLFMETPIVINGVIVGLYTLIEILNAFDITSPKTSVILGQDGNPLRFALVEIYNATLNQLITKKVTTDVGRFYALVPRGVYFLKISQRNPSDENPYTLIHTTEPFNAPKGHIHKHIKIG